MGKRAQKKKIMKDVALFLVKVNILLIPFYGIIYFDISFYPLQILFANFIGWILRLFGYQVTTSDFYLFVGNPQIPVDISRDCIGWKSSYSLFALVFASSGRWKDKLKFLGVWIPVLLVLNVFRVLITILLGLNLGIQYMGMIHTFIWQYVMIFVVVLIWYVWLRKVK